MDRPDPKVYARTATAVLFGVAALAASAGIAMGSSFETGTADAPPTVFVFPGGDLPVEAN